MSKLLPKQSKFPLGALLLSPCAYAWLPEWQIRKALARHAQADWGEVHEEQCADNDYQLKEGGGPVYSAYWTREHLMFYINTNAARTLTRVYAGAGNRDTHWTD
jgi:hypothetical protein